MPGTYCAVTIKTGAKTIHHEHHLMEELLPQVYSVILRINEAFIADMYRRNKIGRAHV